VIAFAATVYLARRLGVASFGIIGFATAIVLYLSRIADGGIDLGLGVREIAADLQGLDRVAPSVLGFRLLVSGALALVLGVVGVLFFPQPDGQVVALYGLTLLTVGASTRWILLGMQRARTVAIARTAGEALMVILVLVLVRDAGDVVRVPLAQFVGDALAAFILAWRLRKMGHSLALRLDWTVVRPIVRRSGRLVLSALLGLMIFNADLIFLRIFRNTEFVGLYAAAYTLISFLLNLGIAYGLSLLPALTGLERDGSEQHEMFTTAVAQVFAIGLPVSVGGFLIAPQVIELVFGGEYSAAAPVLSILVWSVPLSLVRDVPVIALMARGREDFVLRTTGIACALNLALNLTLIPRYGMVGAASATLLTEAVRMGAAWRFAYAEGFPITHFSRLWKALAAAAMMALVLAWLKPEQLWVSIPLGGLVYGLALMTFGGLRFTRGEAPALSV